MRILYIDDDRINLLLFEQVCRLAHTLEVATAGSGVEALQVAREFAPEVLVIDLHLPDTTGFELLPQLRAEAGLSQVGQMARRRRLGHIERLVDVAHADLARRQQAENPSPCLVGQGREDLIQGHIHIRLDEYTTR